ncbi:MAG: 3-methyl-2-oxobutanoate dehydrogenase subunit VorB [Clostridiales bacterium]|nr:3-methyl-2-oxobutanoate dehydrogenase subunit VorB [Clostridiales bacterium]
MAKVLMKGNEAVAEAAIRSGCRHYFGYPITPQTEIAEYMAKRMPKVGGLCLQAESEISAINMVMGAASAGVRAMTSSSSPGISLKCEGISYIAGCDLPCLILNVQRGGPGLGGIQPAQSDYWQATKAMGHGDLHLIVLAPSSVQEMASLANKAFDLADKYRMPAMLLADGALGQMMEPVDLDGIKAPEAVCKPWATCGHDGKRKKNITNSLYINPDDLEKTVIERFARYETVKANEIMYEEYLTEDADIVVVAYGITARICRSAVAMARAQGVKVGLFRPITLWPYPYEALGRLADTASRFIVSELNMGQMIDDVKIAINCRRPVDFCGRTGGVLLTPEEILNAILGGKK